MAASAKRKERGTATLIRQGRGDKNGRKFNRAYPDGNTGTQKDANLGPFCCKRHRKELGKKNQLRM